MHTTPAKLELTYAGEVIVDRPPPLSSTRSMSGRDAAGLQYVILRHADLGLVAWDGSEASEYLPCTLVTKFSASAQQAPANFRDPGTTYPRTDGHTAASCGLDNSIPIPF